MNHHRQHAEADRALALKHVAIQVSTLLPHDRGEALSVLDYARELVENFLNDAEPAPSGRSMTANGVIAYRSRASR